MPAIWRAWKSSKHCSGVNDMAEQHGKALVPQIRFAGFTDPWEQRKFADFAVASGIRNRDNLPLRSYSVSNDRGFVPQDEQFENGGTMREADKSAYWIVEPGSFAYNPARINVGSIGYLAANESVIVSSLYEVFQTNGTCDDRFLWHWFKSPLFMKQIEMLQEGGVRLYFFFDKLLQSEIQMPGAEEQRRIGAFFDRLDSLITLHQRKYDKLCVLKKSMLDKMFPKGGSLYPEIRFAGFTDPWEQRKLGELTEIKDSARIPNRLWREAGVPYIRASDISQEDLRGALFIDEEDYAAYKAATGAPEKGDVLFNGGGEIGKAIINGNSSPIYVQGGAVLYARIAHSSLLDARYLVAAFVTQNVVNAIGVLSAGGTMKHFTLQPAKNLPIEVPSIAEQRRIGAFFDRLDSLITLHQRKLELLRNIKKSMLDKMFV